jgi:phosphoribosylamine--glycine ligase
MAKVLVVGSGGREHALGYFLSRSGEVDEVWTVPGNAGTPGNVALDAGAADGFAALAELAAARRVDLTVVGPEAPLCAGLADAFQARGLSVFGPTAAAARLEGDKTFAREFMRRHGIPHPPFAVFRDPGAAERYVRGLPEGPLVVKAAGLAAGKGVAVCQGRTEALEAVRRSLSEHAFGAAGETVLIEEFLEGEEASILALCDGQRALYLPSSQDHKRAFDGDRGPNTGGMGAYAPAPIVTDEVLRKVERRIVAPTLAGMAAEGTPYRGCLYVGLMIRRGEPSVVEFNCRFGDPESQAVLPLIAGDLFPLLRAAASGDLSGFQVPVRPGAAACVVMACGGYPGSYEKGKPIEGLGRAATVEDLFVFHAGTRLAESGEVLTAGGRVLGVTGLGATIAEAIRTAYRGVELISFEGAMYRRDIGHRALGREVEPRAPDR